MVWTHPIKQHNPPLPRKIMNIPHTLRIPCNRALTENMFPLCKRGLCKGISSADGRANIHRRDSRVVEEGVVGGVCLDEMVGVFGVLL